jgi:hypothetical protein
LKLPLHTVAASIPLPTRRAALLIIAHKALVILLLFMAPGLVPDLFQDQSSLAGRFTTWDARQYLDIAAHGYEVGAERNAFYPLWPMCIRGGSLLTGGNDVLSAYVLANVFSLIGLLLFHRLVWERHGLPLANRAMLLLLVYPGSIFFCFPYTEPLFLLLLMLCLDRLSRETVGAAAVAAFLLPLTRPIGIFILPVIAWHLICRRSRLRSYSLCIAPVLGYLAYLGIMYHYTGSPFAGYEAQERFPTHPSLGQISDLAGFARSFLSFEWRHTIEHSFIDRVVFVSFLISLYWIIRLDAAYYLYAILAGLIPALSASMASYTRYSALVFPLFIVWAQFARKTRSLPFLLMLFFAVQCVFLLLHVAGRWAG